ncbi:TonB-dependent receptor [Pedobacter alpinus]|uniref:TonB-dependent receptor n=1 Tax=Pedobacter alpinus TaxID=1590643 RepID=A0ABW5TQZ6_9SPHI
MQIKKNLLIGAFCLFQSFLFAQNKSAQITGKVVDPDGYPIPGALIKLQNTNQTSITDVDGSFLLQKLAAGKHLLKISSVGMIPQQKEITIKAGESQTLTIKLAENIQQLETIEVFGRTETQEVNRQAFNVTAIDAKKLYNTTLDISSALDRVAGVRVRESGGVGSNFDLSINGFSGNNVRYFIDGIPMDNFGSSFQINNIPINIAERIEVYKGVVPIWLGSDALGGAVNIVTANRQKNYVDVSYSYGSFNTHRSVINTAITSKKGLTFQLNAFQNYSDNNYKVQVEASNNYTGAYAPSATLRRFHDTYHNEALIANVGVTNKSYADRLLFGITLGQNYKEIQTGARMASVFGGWHRRGNIIMPTLKYKKDDLIKGLSVAINANYNFGSERNIDTMNVRFDWYGNSKPNGSSGERSRSLYKYNNNNGLATAMVSYKVNENSSLALSNNFSTFDRKGNDPLNSANNETPRKTNKNVLGIGYTFAIEDIWSVNTFAKYYYQVTTIGNLANRTTNIDKLGYGAAFNYFINKNLQIRTSYELTNRLPEAIEIFGDVENQEGNPNLKPQESDNINIGVIYNFAINKGNSFSVNVNGAYRYATDFIYTRLNQNQSKVVADNRDGVNTWAVDAELRYTHKQWLNAGFTLTYQYLKNLQKFEIDPSTGQYYSMQSLLYLNQMPNIPFLFGNFDATATIKNIGNNGSNLSFGTNLLYINNFYLYWPAYGGVKGKYGIPLQVALDANVVYSLANGKYNIGLEAKNITDVLMYDNFSLQKPSRGFYLNLRYFISKK